MAKKKHLSKASGTPTFPCMNHGGKRKGAGRKAKLHADGSRVDPSHQKRPRFTKSRPLHITLEVHEDVPDLRAANGMRSVNGTIAKAVNERLRRKGRVLACRFHLHVLRTKREVRNAVQYVLRNAERHGLHDAWGTRSRMAANGLPRPDPLSTAAWFPYWAEQELRIAPTQIPASVVRPARCFLMTLAFEGAPLSFAEPMRCATGTPRHRSKARAEPTEVERGRDSGLRRIKLRVGDGNTERPASEAPPIEGALALGRRSARPGPHDR